MADITTNAASAVAQIADTAKTVEAQVATTVAAATPVVQEAVANAKADAAQVVAAVQPVVEEAKQQGFFAKIISKILAIFKII